MVMSPEPETTSAFRTIEPLMPVCRRISPDPLAVMPGVPGVPGLITMLPERLCSLMLPLLAVVVRSSRLWERSLVEELKLTWVRLVLIRSTVIAPVSRM